ncbi:MAG: RNA methyltransferase [Prevotella sp.]|nr:RNA methyltransferase [Prevotella sp.]
MTGIGISKAQQKLIRSLEQKKHRQREGLFVAEGPKVVGDLLQAGFQAEWLYSTGPYLQDEALQVAMAPQVVEVTDEALRRVSFLQHPQGVLAVFRMPEEMPMPVIDTLKSSIILALDGVQDPGNLGTIIRIADWFGIDTICCSMDTADAWNPKVVQASMGSIARVHIIYMELTELAEKAKAAGVPVYGMLLDGMNIYEQPLSSHGIIVMGNEGNGISAAMRQHVTHRLLIPDFHKGQTADSLNVAIATAITCSEFRRR